MRLPARTRNTLREVAFFGGQVNLDLDDYMNERAMEGLFLKRVVEERAIHTHPIVCGSERHEQVFVR